MATAPKRAQDLLLKALLWWEQEHGTAPNVDLVWVNRRAASHAQNFREPYRITINAGGRGWGRQKLSLLHELAHVLTPKQGHKGAFWDVAWTLYRWAKLPIKQTLAIEGNYKVGARVAYHRALGHTEAVKQRRLNHWDCPTCHASIASGAAPRTLARYHYKRYPTHRKH